MEKTITPKSLLLKVLVPGVSIKIGTAYASRGGFEEGQIIELVNGIFEVDDGYGRTETAPAIWNESQKEFDSIFHLFGDDLDIEDCEILGVVPKRKIGIFEIRESCGEFPFKVYDDTGEQLLGVFYKREFAETFADAMNIDSVKRFQADVKEWMFECFGEEITYDHVERNHRYIEESIEVAQAFGCTEEEVMQLVRYVFNRPTGEKEQEVGGALVTLAALCIASNIDMFNCGDTELARIKVPETMLKIRAKQAAKPRFSPLPQ